MHHRRLSRETNRRIKPLGLPLSSHGARWLYLLKDILKNALRRNRLQTSNSWLLIEKNSEGFAPTFLSCKFETVALIIKCTNLKGAKWLEQTVSDTSSWQDHVLLVGKSRKLVQTTKIVVKLPNSYNKMDPKVVLKKKLRHKTVGSLQLNAAFFMWGAAHWDRLLSLACLKLMRLHLAEEDINFISDFYKFKPKCLTRLQANIHHSRSGATNLSKKFLAEDFHLALIQELW